MASNNQPVHTSASPGRSLGVAQRIAAVAASKPSVVQAKPPKRVAAKAIEQAASPLDKMALTRTGNYSLTSGKSVLVDERLPGVEFFVELLTPELAEHYLSKLPARQRKLSPKTVDRYSADMSGDQWLFTGDPIRFNTNEELIDGQHRCRAIAESGVAQMAMIVIGLDADTIIVFDTGRPRSFADHLTMNGVVNASGVSTMTKRVLQWRRGNYAVDNIARVANPRYLGVSCSTPQLAETYNLMPDLIRDATRRGMSLSSCFPSKTAAPSVLGFAYLLLGGLDLERRERFFFEIERGPESNEDAYPINALRRRLQKHLPAGQSGLPDWVWLHFIFHTWNKCLAAESLGVLTTPSRPQFGHVALPMDPQAGARPHGWEPLAGVSE